MSCAFLFLSPVARPLADLALHKLACVADALALVGLGRSNGPDRGCRLAYDLFVDAAHQHDLGLRRLELDALRGSMSTG